MTLRPINDIKKPRDEVERNTELQTKEDFRRKENSRGGIMAEKEAEEKKRISHDKLFKEFLQRFLPEFLELFFSREGGPTRF